jgi:pimeloyl-ACP methyl ester carboxylesterase
VTTDGARAFVEVTERGEVVRLEYRLIETAPVAAPRVVFLHEGLGSLSAWRDFPDRLCAAARVRGVVYSRAGYGWSTPRPHASRWGTDFMHLQARNSLPALLRALSVDTENTPPWLFGHSDGASIALIYAATFPHQAAGVIAVAPHLFVEDLSIRSIERTRDTYRTSDLAQRLGRHHGDVESAFWGWNDIWLDPAFRSWNIESLLPSIRCPVLAVQGHDDEYGTMAQIDHLAAGVAQAQLVKLANCGHSPHRDQPAALIEAAAGFIKQHTNRT